MGDANFTEEIASNWLSRAFERDVIVLGIQECDSNLTLALLHKISAAKGYFFISVISMWKMMVVGYAKNSIQGLISNIKTASKSTGFASVIGNKGGVCLSFNICRTSFCFISSHLAAGAGSKNNELRKKNYYELIKELKHEDTSIDMPNCFDYCFFVGDFNFRIEKLFNETVEATKNEKIDYEALLECDQLSQERKKETVFTGFAEWDVRFRPTYRRMRNTNLTWSNKNDQSPSWCDRIMYRSRSGYLLELQEYYSVEEQMGSDHKPVCGLFKLEFKLPFLLSAFWDQKEELNPQKSEKVLQIRKVQVDVDSKVIEEMKDMQFVKTPCVFSVRVKCDQTLTGPQSTETRPSRFLENSSILRATWEESLFKGIFLDSDLAYMEKSLIEVGVMVWNSATSCSVFGIFSQFVFNYIWKTGGVAIPLKPFLHENSPVVSVKSHLNFLGRLAGTLKLEAYLQTSEWTKK
jgi:hypothetical protein